MGRGPAFRGPRPVTPPDETGLLEEENELIAGRRPVEEAFAARREAVRLLVVPERRAALDQLVIHATTLRIPVVELEGGSLTALAGFDGHQGVALVARPRQHVDLADIVAHARQRGAAPFVLVLDSLEDPQNFGTLLRSAEATGVDGVVYPTRRAAPLSPAAIKASAGATEHLMLAPVDDLAGALVDLRGHGLRIVGADEDAPLDFAEADLRGPLAIVVGSEGRGISGPVRKRLDLSVRIPMRGKLASLNASVAGSLLLFAAAGQRPAEETAAAQPEKPVEPAEEPKPRSKRAEKAKSDPDQQPDAAAEALPAAAEAPSIDPPKAPRKRLTKAAKNQESEAGAEPATEGAVSPSDDLLPGDSPPTGDAPPRPARKPRRSKAPSEQ